MKKLVVLFCLLSSATIYADFQDANEEVRTSRGRSFISWCQAYQDGDLDYGARHTMYQMLSRVYFRRNAGYYSSASGNCYDARDRLRDKYSLSLTESRIKDLRPLASLAEFPRLRELIIDNNGIRDLSGIGRLTQLESIRLDENYVNDISPLTGLTKLRYLDLSENKVDDWSPLASMTSLVELNLSYCGIHSVRSLVNAVKNLPNLQKLILSANDITDSTPLNELNPNIEVVLSKEDMCNNIIKSSPLWQRELCREYVCDGLDEMTDDQYMLQKKWRREFCESTPQRPEDRRFTR